jgi:malate/lactate dehydrogenase
MKIGIIGAAGTLGSCAAFAILERRLPGELWLFDLNRNLLQAHFLDLQIAASAMGAMTVHAAESSEALAGCNVVVVTAGTPWREIANRMELLDDNLAIVEKIAVVVGRLCPKAVVINATNPVDPLNYAFHLITGMERSKLLGYSINDSYRLRMYIARAFGISPTRVGGLVGGEHGPHQVPFWSTVTVDGKRVEVSPEVRQQVLGDVANFLRSYESLRTGRTAGWVSAVGIGDMVRAIVLDTSDLFPCSVVLAGEYPDRRGFSAGVPVRLGKDGVAETVRLSLPADEQKALESSFNFLQETAGVVRNKLGVRGIQSATETAR